MFFRCFHEKPDSIKVGFFEYAVARCQGKTAFRPGLLHTPIRSTHYLVMSIVPQQKRVYTSLQCKSFTE